MSPWRSDSLDRNKSFVSGVHLTSSPMVTYAEGMDNRKNTQHKNRAPIADRLEMIDAYRHSGLTRRQFSGMHDASPGF